MHAPKHHRICESLWLLSGCLHATVPSFWGTQVKVKVKVSFIVNPMYVQTYRGLKLRFPLIPSTVHTETRHKT